MDLLISMLIDNNINKIIKSNYYMILNIILYLLVLSQHK